MTTMTIEERIPLIEEILDRWRPQLGPDHAGYRNHVYRVAHHCLALHASGVDEREKVLIAASFHDLGIWSDDTFDYLAPSAGLARRYLLETRRETWIPEVESMIDLHHKIRRHRDAEHPLIEAFRKSDLVDVSLGFIRCGLPKSHVRDLQTRFPNAGFHKMLVRRASRWFARHPLNPVPVLKW